MRLQRWVEAVHRLKALEVAWGWLATGWDLFPEALADRVTWTYADMAPWRLAFTTRRGLAFATPGGKQNVGDSL